MSQEPGRLVLDLKDAGELVRADALLARHDQVDGLKHLVERHAGMLENGARLHGELLAALAALFQAPANDTFGFFTLGFERTPTRS